MRPPIWLTATPPTPNGELHIGHMAGPYVAVDVLRRFLCGEGAGVLMTTGLDDHQSYVAVRAESERGSGFEVADRYGECITAAWRAAGIEFDRVVAPRQTAGYGEFVQAFFAKLHETGWIVPRKRPLPYCAGCDRWLYEALVAGACPHCGAGSNGNACESCGRPNDCGDLGDPRCTRCGEPAELREQTRLYFPLARFEEQLAAFWSATAMPPHLHTLCRRMAADGLPEIAVSHPSDWGLPVPVLGYEDQRIYVWFEMAPGYLLEYDPGTGRPQTGPVQFFGFDNGYFHAVLFPALFLAWDPQLPLAQGFVVNEFYRLEGEKFSTSRRHAVWAAECLARSGADALRFHVLRDRPNGRQTSFAREDVESARRHLHAHWNGWLHGMVEALRAGTGGVVPQEAPDSDDWHLLRGRMLRTVAELREAYSVSGFDPRRVIALLDEMVSCAYDFGQVHQHESDPAAHRAALAGQLAAARALAAWAAPALPAGAGRLAGLLGVPPGGRVDQTALAPPPPGSRLAAPAGPVFGS